MQRSGAEPLHAGSAPLRDATRASAERGANDSPQGRPKVDQLPRGLRPTQRLSVGATIHRRAAPKWISPLGGQRPAQRRSVGALFFTSLRAPAFR